MLLKALDGSLKMPPLTLSHHLEISPILSFGSRDKIMPFLARKIYKIKKTIDKAKVIKKG
jgi:hypothetical protein